MIFTIERFTQSTLWLAKIEEAEELGKDGGMLRLKLVGPHGRTTAVLLDLDTFIQHLFRVVGMYSDTTELIGREVVVVFDQLGNPVAFYEPMDIDREPTNLHWQPPAPSADVQRSGNGQVWSQVGIGPQFHP